MKIAIAVSGGVDSLYALVSLKEAGHDVVAVHARFINTLKENDPVPLLSEVCKKLEVPLHIVDLKEDFAKNVIRPFLESYARSETPNPCAHCNKTIKFGRLLDIARNLSVQAFATGHYVNMHEYFLEDNSSYGLCLKSAQDTSKDQSYFLALTPLESLRFGRFPLADKIKKDIVEELKQKNISVPIKKESQEVCFVPNDNYREFIELEREKRGIVYQGAGDIIYKDDNVEKKVGTHEGLWRYTEGQRKGLGIAWSEPLYVIKKEETSNILYVGTRAYLDISIAYATNINFLVNPKYWKGSNLNGGKKTSFCDLTLQSNNQCGEQSEINASYNSIFYVRTRFREKPSPAKVYLIFPEENGLELLTDKQNYIELGTEHGRTVLEKWVLEKWKDTQATSYKQGVVNNTDENMLTNSYLWHIQEENTRYESMEEEKYTKERAFWNSMQVAFKVVFLSPKQVYAKGQVLAIYDENGFVLAGASLK